MGSLSLSLSASKISRPQRIISPVAVSTHVCLSVCPCGALRTTLSYFELLWAYSMRRTLSCLSLVCTTRWAGLFPSYRTLASVCVCVRTCMLPYCSSCLWCVWNSIHTLGAHTCLFISLCLLSQPLFVSVGQASARIVASLTLSLSHVSIDS